MVYEPYVPSQSSDNTTSSSSYAAAGSSPYGAAPAASAPAVAQAVPSYYGYSSTPSSVPMTTAAPVSYSASQTTQPSAQHTTASASTPYVASATPSVAYATSIPASAPVQNTQPTPSYGQSTPSYGQSIPASAPVQNTQSTPSYGQSTPSYGQSIPASAPVQNTQSTPSYGQYSSQPASAATPNFSQALDLPPPSTTTTATTTNTDYYNQKTPINAGAPTPTAPIASVSTNPSKTPDYYNQSINNSAQSGTVISQGNPTKCHKVDYQIIGNDMQLVEVELDPDETVIAEAGAMMYLEDEVSFKAKLGDGSNPSQGFFGTLFSAAGRIITGESLFLTHFTNKAPQGKKRVAFAAPYPGSIIPINMGGIGEKLICQKDAFLCAAYGTKVAIHFNKRLGSGLFGGEGFILQRLEGDGMAFVHAGGTIIKKELKGDRLRLDTGCLVAFTSGIDFSVEFAPGLKTAFFGGEGIFLATLQGHGTVWLQSLPFSRLADRILANAPSAGGKRTGEGNNLTGGFGDLIDGDGFGGR